MSGDKLLRMALEQSVQPFVLYHGSGYFAKELSPGIRHSGKLVQWDETESNEYLYATTDQNTAIELGIASAIEHRFQLDRFQTTPEKVVVTTPAKDFDRKALAALEVWLYELTPNPHDGWVANHSKVNHLETEFKTKKTVRYRLHRRVDVEQWMRGRTIEILHP